ncbi:MAG: ZIP family metal transporter [Sphingobacteriaceae bacterium]
MEIWKIALLFACAFLGGLTIFFSKKASNQRLKLILSFSGAYLFAITVLHLIPEVYQSGNASIGLFVIGGFLFQIVLEQFSEGIEHGHIHAHNHRHMAFPFGIMASLCIHAFLEGMPLAKGPQDELVFGIAIHHIPAAFALGMVLLQNKVSKQMIVVLLAVFALMSPLGYFLSDSLSKGAMGNLEAYFNQIMGVVIGMFLHISTTILFESSVDHRFNLKKLAAVLLGIGVAVFGFLSH